MEIRNTEILSKGPPSTMRAIVHITTATSGVTASSGDFTRRLAPDYFKPKWDVRGRLRR